ncbi:Pentatricopeptide repeat-containing protein [Camellia lanceoleosa]|uniref:Pentatricopeptide repeat-containing protein n=1 Tax=Camellia lanceoleosa TaxID=1840588 RepID=A0ACC0G2F4_9ERIC|nr:Pentatricopeptide repeat-containing protein [Camellia lanceoleosa]
MLSVCTKSGQYVEIFRQMQYNGVQPSHVSIISILPACAALATFSFGKQIHGLSIKRECYSLTNVQNSLVDMYAKCGYHETSIQVFNRIENKDLVSWRTMIHGCIANECPRTALNMFSGMQSCWNWFYAMEKIYGITPKLAHYACMVDLLSRQGHVEEALEFGKSMPIEPDKRIWGALLAGCRSICGSIEIAEFVVEQLIRLDQENTSCYLVLSNLYAEQFRWEDVERMRKLVNKKGLRKETGYSIIEANS